MMSKIIKKIREFFKKICKISIIVISISLVISFVNKTILVIIENNQDLKEHNPSAPYKYIASDSAEETSIKGAYLSISAPRKYNESKGCKTLNEFNQSTPCSSVTVGDDVVFLLSYTGNISYINLTANCIVFNGFTSNIEIYKAEDDPKNILVVLKGIKAPYTSDKISISVTGGTAISSNGEMANSVSSSPIVVYQKDLNRLMLWVLEESSSLGTFLAAIIALYVGINYNEKKENAEKNS